METKEIKNHPYSVGSNYFIRTVTMYFTGKLVSVFENELVLTHVAWISDTGNFTKAMTEGVFDEIEMYPIETNVIVSRGGIIDASIFNFSLPTRRK